MSRTMTEKAKRTPTETETRRRNAGNVPGVLGMQELAALSGKPYRTPGLPSTWHDVLSADGKPLYWRREHSGYQVHPAYGRFVAIIEEHQPQAIVQNNIGTYATLTHAIVACRDHMHANNVSHAQTEP